MAIFDMKRPAPGVPARDSADPLEPKMQAALLTRPATETRIGKTEILEAASILQKYKDGKANLENRVIEDELWWELRHWEVIRRQRNPDTPEPSSAWLFNAIANKHADAMDNFPEPVVLPREKSDERSAKVLSSVLPVILEQNDFEQTYSDAWWEKLKHGTAVYGIFWNAELENGLGDIDIKPIDLLKIFWEPGITYVQKSRNLFLTDLVDTELLEQQYPQFKGRLGRGSVDLAKYLYDENIDTENKSVVVDWYYKLRTASGKTVLQYAKFVNDCLLYASENDPEYADRGFYDHGMYPVVFDTMFPEKGTPVGFGYVSICKDPQLYIDRLGANILETSMMGTKKRFFVSSSTNINRDQLLDWNEPQVQVEGEIDDRRIKEITVEPMAPIYFNVLQAKIEELKDTASNRDVNSGGTGSGVTAAAAIAALQEAGNKVSRDVIQASYRAHRRISVMVIELIRQFYDEARSFRVTGEMPGQYDFIDVSNAGMQDQIVGQDAMGNDLYRRPVFDLKISAQKKNPFSRVSQNEYAKELYGLGFFNPERAQEAMGALNMMDFEGIDKVKEQVQEGQTLLNIVQQMSDRLNQAMMLIQALTGSAAPAASSTEGGEIRSAAAPKQVPSGGVNSKAAQAQAPMTSYGDRLAKRSTPDMSMGAQ